MFTGTLQSDMKMDRTKAGTPGHFPPATLITKRLFCPPHPLLGDKHLPRSLIMKMMDLRRDEQNHNTWSICQVLIIGQRGRNKASLPISLNSFFSSYGYSLLGARMFSSVAHFSAWHFLILETPGKTEQRWDMHLLSTDHCGINREISEEFLGKRSDCPWSVLPTSLTQLCLTH